MSFFSNVLETQYLLDVYFGNAYMLLIRALFRAIDSILCSCILFRVDFLEQIRFEQNRNVVSADQLLEWQSCLSPPSDMPESLLFGVALEKNSHCEIS